MRIVLNWHPSCGCKRMVIISILKIITYTSLTLGLDAAVSFSLFFRLLFILIVKQASENK